MIPTTKDVERIIGEATKTFVSPRGSFDEAVKLAVVSACNLCDVRIGELEEENARLRQMLHQYATGEKPPLESERTQAQAEIARFARTAEVRLSSLEAWLTLVDRKLSKIEEAVNGGGGK